jgi:hypothetical protein
MLTFWTGRLGLRFQQFVFYGEFLEVFLDKLDELGVAFFVCFLELLVEVLLSNGKPPELGNNI